MKTDTAAKFSDGSFLPVIDKCEGCGRIVEVDSSKRSSKNYNNRKRIFNNNKLIHLIMRIGNEFVVVWYEPTLQIITTGRATAPQIHFQNNGNKASKRLFRG